MNGTVDRGLATAQPVASNSVVNSNNSSNGTDIGSTEAIAYHRLALQLHHDLPRNAEPRTVLLASANRAPGTARLAIQLAHSLAEQLQAPVLLVDAHPASADISHLLGCAALPGFADLLADPALRPQDLSLPTSHRHVSVLPAGVVGAAVRTRSPESVLRVVRALAEGPDVLLLHGGPVLDDTIAMALAPCVERVLLVAFENQTLLTDLDLAQRALSACKARRVGLVIASGSTAR